MTVGRGSTTTLVLSLIVVACAVPAPAPSPSPAADPSAGRTGGTLRVGMNIADYEFFQQEPDGAFDHSWDPQTTWANEPFELFRCCLLRTLMSYNGRSTAEGGAELQPDLAADYPIISADGLTWTFNLKPDLHYAPPMADTPIVSGDIIRAIERTVRPDPISDEPRAFGPYSRYFIDVIVGAEEFSTGAVSSISGLEAPNPQTLVVRLVNPVGDLGARLAMPAAAPLPAGAADGHDTGYGPYLVASGPYMIEGSEGLDPALPVEQQPAVAGYVPGTSLTLVRNPSWDRETDNLRLALVDRIEIAQADDYEAALQSILADELDLHFLFDLDPADITRLRAESATASQVHVVPAVASDWITMNLAVAPFDDLHVRRAINFITNKAALVEMMRPDAAIQAHAIPDALENDLLLGYNPYATVGDVGSVDQAKAEMALSAYDSDADGVCDSSVCEQVRMPVRNDLDGYWPAALSFASELAAIGIELELEEVEVFDFFGQIFDPSSQTPIAFTAGWTSDYLSASGWFGPLAASASVNNQEALNLSLIGASPEDLKSWGYTVTDVPSLDASISSCAALSGANQFECWARVDQYLMERIAPWVPLDNRQSSRVVSPSVRQFTFDVALGMPALDQIQLDREP